MFKNLSGSDSCIISRTVVRYSCRTVVVPPATTKKGSEDKNQRRAEENSPSSTTKRESDETNQRLLRNWLIAKWIIDICIFIAVGCVVGLIVVGSSNYQCPNCPIVNVTHGTPTTIKPTTVPPNIKKEGMQTKK